jgi:hypothetical protein
VPAAAVIPAPIAYIKVVAVKKLVVGLVSHAAGSSPVDVNLVVTIVGRPAGGAHGVVGRKVGGDPAPMLLFSVLFIECLEGPARLL